MSDDNRLERIENKIDKLDDGVSELKVVAAGNLESLKAHMQRTLLLEQIVLPIEKKYQQVIGIGKFVGFVALVAGIVESIVLLLAYIRNIHV